MKSNLMTTKCVLFLVTSENKDELLSTPDILDSELVGKIIFYSNAVLVVQFQKKSKYKDNIFFFPFCIYNLRDNLK